MKHWLAAFGLSVALVLATPVAAEEPPESENPSELAREGVERLMRALEALIDSIPQYEMPEINEYGDIIIRRKRQAAPDALDDEDIEQTQT